MHTCMNSHLIMGATAVKGARITVEHLVRTIQRAFCLRSSKLKSVVMQASP